MAKVLVQRYDNEDDIRAVRTNGCSDTYARAIDDVFEFVIVVPTLNARSDLSAICRAKSGQYPIENQIFWPGRADDYKFRVDVELIKFKALSSVRPIIEEGISNWAAQWQVLNADLDMGRIL
jgi:hypothetical protein